MSKRSMYKNNLVIGLALIFQSCGYQTSTLKSQLDESNSLRPIPEYEDSSYASFPGGSMSLLSINFKNTYLNRASSDICRQKPQKEDVNTISIPMKLLSLICGREIGGLLVKEDDNVSQVAFTCEGDLGQGRNLFSRRCDLNGYKTSKIKIV